MVSDGISGTLTSIGAPRLFGWIWRCGECMRYLWNTGMQCNVATLVLNLGSDGE